MICTAVRSDRGGLRAPYELVPAKGAQAPPLLDVVHGQGEPPPSFPGEEEGIPPGAASAAQPQTLSPLRNDPVMHPEREPEHPEPEPEPEPKLDSRFGVLGDRFGTLRISGCTTESSTIGSQDAWEQSVSKMSPEHSQFDPIATRRQIGFAGLSDPVVTSELLGPEPESELDQGLELDLAAPMSPVDSRFGLDAVFDQVEPAEAREVKMMYPYDGHWLCQYADDSSPGLPIEVREGRWSACGHRYELNTDQLDRPFFVWSDSPQTMQTVASAVPDPATAQKVVWRTDNPQYNWITWVRPPPSAAVIHSSHVSRGHQPPQPPLNSEAGDVTALCDRMMSVVNRPGGDTGSDFARNDRVRARYCRQQQQQRQQQCPGCESCSAHILSRSYSGQAFGAQVVEVGVPS